MYLGEPQNSKIVKKPREINAAKVSCYKKVLLLSIVIIEKFQNRSNILQMSANEILILKQINCI